MIVLKQQLTDPIILIAYFENTNRRQLNMSFNQIIKSEWESVEVPVSLEEKSILQMIIEGYTNVNIKHNHNLSIASFLKIENGAKMEDYLYIRYFMSLADTIYKIKVRPTKELTVHIKKPNAKNKSNTIKKADMLRIGKNEESDLKDKNLYEYELLDHIHRLFKNDSAIIALCESEAKAKAKAKAKSETKSKSKTELTTRLRLSKLRAYHYFTLSRLVENSISKLNRHVLTFCQEVLDEYEFLVPPIEIIENSVEFIERNTNLLKYNDIKLYDHQKDIFTIFKTDGPKLVLYAAPTGTGKTITPIAIASHHRVIFVCAARHVGLAMARAAVSMGKKVAFAFGCDVPSDIRLHNFAAKVFTKKSKQKGGGIKTIDNSVGDLVEIMICDIKSFVLAHDYMLEFNQKEDMIVYWDEPTISLDYQEHDYHSLIHTNWTYNMIPNMVLSSATLPKAHELHGTISNFKNRFPGVTVHSIVSHDSKKSIPLLNREGQVVLPHFLAGSDVGELHDMVDHCLDYLTIIRYFDLEETVLLIRYVLEHSLKSNKLDVERRFENIGEVSLRNIKVYYLELLRGLSQEQWSQIRNHFMQNRVSRITENLKTDETGKTKLVGTTDASNAAATSSNPGVYVTTKDAFTLTDGPTIFITDEIEKISQFYIGQSNIPKSAMLDIMNKVEHNNKINKQIGVLSAELDAANLLEKGVAEKGQGSNTKKADRDAYKEDEGDSKSAIRTLTNSINILTSNLKPAILNETFIPNKPLHKEKWARHIPTSLTNAAFTSDVSEHTVTEIMALEGVADSWKVMLMMGIGVFTHHENPAYTVIMKTLANEQKLYMIIASSDYIYGTNYPLCHAYIGKDMALTQEKIIQSLGRVGRNNVQKNYTVRFRSNDLILKLFTKETDKPEIANMNRLFAE
jgi:hypothetical protein